MTSRERVLEAVNFRRPDRIPVDLGAIRASGVSAVVYDRLKKRMGIGGPTKVHDSMQVLAEVEIEVLDRLHADIVPLDVTTVAWDVREAREGVPCRLFSGLEVFFPPGTRIMDEPDGCRVLLDSGGAPYARMPRNGYYFDFIRPTMSGRTIDPAKFHPRDTVPDETLDIIARRARDLFTNTDKAILGWGNSISLIGLSAMLSDNITQGALDEWLCMLMTEKETAHDMMGRYADAVISCLGLYHEATGERCFGWGVASDDAGTQRGEFISPDLFTEMILPHYRRVCSWVHEHTNWKTYLHSCGSVRNYLPGWIDAGIDIFNPVQISAAGMDPESLMKEFGGKIVFWGGGCDTQKVLPLGTPEEVRAHVAENIRVFGALSGGYVFNQVHNIQETVPVENVEAMFAAAFEYGGKAKGTEAQRRKGTK